MKGGQVIGQFAAQLVNAGNDQLPVSAIFKARIFADLFVILVSRQMHAQNRVVVVGAGEFCRGIRDQHLDQFVHIHATRAYDFHTDALANVAVFDDCAFCHNFPPQRRLRARSL